MSQIIKPLTASGPIPPNIPTQFTTDDGAHVVPLANNLNVFGGTGATTSGNVGTGTVTINVVNDGFIWSEKTTNFNAVTGNAYFCNNPLTVTLPGTGGLTIGNTVIIYADTINPVTIQAAAGQSIQIGLQISIPAGTAISQTRGSTLVLVFKPSDLTWHTISSLGSWELNVS